MVLVCVLYLLVWEIKRNLKSVIMVVGKAGREGATHFISRWGFLSLVQLPLESIMLQIRKFHLSFKLEASS